MVAHTITISLFAYQNHTLVYFPFKRLFWPRAAY